METDVTLYQNNVLSQSRQNFLPVEKNCIYLIIEEVQKKYVFSNTGQRGLFDDLIIQFNGSQLSRAVSNRSHKDAYKSMKRLRTRLIEIKQGNDWLITGYINYAKYISKSDLYEIQVSKEIIPYLVALTENDQFTSYQLTVAISLRSQYAKRFYELCNQYKNQKLTNGTRWFFLTIDKIRELFMFKDTKRTIEIKRDTINIAQKELQAAFEKGESDLYFTYDIKDKQGKKELSYNFYIHTREDEERKAFNYATLPQIMGHIDSILTAYVKRNPKYIKRIKEAVQLNPDIAQPMLEKLFKITEKYERKEIVPVIYYVLNEDFDIQAKN